MEHPPADQPGATPPPFADRPVAPVSPVAVSSLTPAGAALELTYAPPQRSANRALWVLLAGLATTAVALLGVYLLDSNSDTNVMGWYVNYVLPVGALIVGLVAGSGYGIVSWLLGVKIRRGLLWGILGLQVLAYFAAQYIEFRGHGDLYDKTTGQPVGFFEYFHVVTTNFAWKKEHGEGVGEPLGMAGYFFKLLEVAGFVCGGLIVPGVLFKHPYCELCQVYMKNRRLAVFPASIPAKKIKDPAARSAHEQEQVQAHEQANERFKALKESARAGDYAGFRRQLNGRPEQRRADALPVRLAVDLVYCRNCRGGHMKATLLSGQGKQLKTVELEKVELPQDLVRESLRESNAGGGGLGGNAA